MTIGPAGESLTFATVLYEGDDVLAATLPVLFTALAGAGVQLVVVDNSPSEAPRRRVVELAASTGCDVRYVSRPQNPGFAASANEAVGLCATDWVFLVNADVTVSRGDVDALIAHVAAKQTLEPSAISLVTNGRPTCGVELDRWGYFSDRPSGARVPCLGPSGGAALLPRALFEGLGGFREEFFAWGEDAELSLRMWAAGVRTEELHLDLDHVGGHSLSGINALRRKARWLARNRLYALRDDYTLTFRWTYGLLQVAMMVANGIRKIPAATAAAHFGGMLEGLRRVDDAARLRAVPPLGVADFRSYRRGETRPR